MDWTHTVTTFKLSIKQQCFNIVPFWLNKHLPKTVRTRPERPLPHPPLRTMSSLSVANCFTLRIFQNNILTKARYQKKLLVEFSTKGLTLSGKF